ncbi:MAG: 2-oxo acid dehydrogenase subunit E2 [Deltaproteobacteria bacterium]|nr:2-oxo acid dehydrogenase subunit E2 [Deltaproteobacteria bacterium]
MNSTRRKLAIGTWSAPKEGNIYGKLTLNVEPALAYIERVKEQTGQKVTLTHFVGKAVAMALAKSPGLNGRILWGKYIQHETVDISYLVVLEGGGDLAKAKIRDLDKKPLEAVATELRALAEKLRAGKDKEFEATKSTLKLIPRFLVRPLLWVTGWLASSLGLSIGALGVSKFPFGSAIITSVGMFGLDEGFVPPTPFARVPIYVLVGAVSPRPTVVNGEIVIQKQLTITATLDHRFVDGFEGGQLAKTVRAVFEHPHMLDVPKDGVPAKVEAPKADAKAEAKADEKAPTA